jgi:hypothetical protein
MNAAGDDGDVERKVDEFAAVPLALLLKAFADAALFIYATNAVEHEQSTQRERHADH